MVWEEEFPGRGSLMFQGRSENGASDSGRKADKADVETLNAEMDPQGAGTR